MSDINGLVNSQRYDVAETFFRSSPDLFTKFGNIMDRVLASEEGRILSS